MLAAGHRFVVSDILVFNPSILESVQFEFDVVIVVEVVQADYFMAVLHQTLGQVEADKTCRTCDENFQWLYCWIAKLFDCCYAHNAHNSHALMLSRSHTLTKGVGR